MPRKTEEPPAPPPIHQAIRKEQIVPEPVVESISRYQFLDEEKVAKVYIPLENIGQLDDECITADFQSQSFCVDIRDYKPNTILRLSITSLEDEARSCSDSGLAKGRVL